MALNIFEERGPDAAAGSTSFIQATGDPRSDLKRSLEALLVAQLVENDCWIVLSDLARSAGREALAKRFEEALAEERAHLASVRAWMGSAKLGAAMPPRATATPAAS